MALALYRKYRPKTLTDLLGQEHVADVLRQAAAHNKLGHAYLFFGPRGTGKTTAARILAKIACCATRAENAKFRATGEPCNDCTPCNEIDAGRGLDVVEIDAASNRGIDEIRALKEGIRLAPSSYPFKVFIIDEMHMLTKEAFNALLKTLEEPPAHALIILATTEFDKVPATIASRTQRFHFKKHTIEVITKKLAQIAKTEKFSADPEALEYIASLAEGSFRDAESLLEQMASLSTKITLEAVEKNLGVVGSTRVSSIAHHLIVPDIKAALAQIAEVNELGFNATTLTKELIEYLRRALTLRFNPDLEAEFKKEITTAELTQLKDHASVLVPEKQIALIRGLIKAYSEMRYSPFGSIPLEVALIEHVK